MSLRNRLLLPIALFAIAMLVACGSSTSTPVPPPSGAFSNTDFTGTYTFSVLGWDNVPSTFAMSGSFTACGCSAGTISGGTVDIEDITGADTLNTVGNNSVYNITQDGRGTARLFMTTSGGTALPEIDVDFVLTSGSHGLISRYDANGGGSGTIDSQGSGVALGTGAYAFSLSGSDLADNALATAGAFTLTSGGAIVTTGASAGIQDFAYPTRNNYQGVALSGSVTLGSGTTPGTATLSSSFGTLTFDVYTISSSHLKLIESDGLYLLVGDLFTESTPSIPSGNLVFSGGGLDPDEELFVTGGTVTSDGSSQLTSGLQDVNDAGSVDGGATTLPAPSSFTGSFAVTPASNLRFLATLSGFFNGETNFALYPSDSGILFLEVDTTANAGVTSGVLLAQTSGAGFISSQGYGLNLTGEDFSNGVGLDEIAQFNTNSSGASLSGLLDENDGGSLGTSNLSGTISAGSGGTGVVTNLSAGTAGFLYYAASTTSIVFIPIDLNVGVGILEGQTSPSSASADVVQRHVAMVKAAARSKKASHQAGSASNK